METNSNNIIFCQAEIPYENQGDLVINKVLLMKLRKYGRLIVNDNKVPAWYCKQLDLAYEERVSTYQRRFPVLIFLWGLKTLFNPHKNVYLMLRPGHFYGEKDSLVNKMKWATLYYFILKFIGIRVCRIGTSIGSFSDELKQVEKWRAKSMYFYSVRDSISQDYALKIGIGNVRVFPDLAWLIEKQNEGDRLTWLMQTPDAHNQPLQLEKNDYVVFSFRETFKEFNASQYKENLFAVLDEIVNTVCGEWLKKLVICYQVRRDSKVCQELIERYKSRCEVIFIEDYLDSQYMYDLYSGASMVFSNRLHVLIFAMRCDSISIAIIDAKNEEKIVGIFSDAGLKRLILDIGKEPAEVSILPEIAANSHQIKEEIAACFDRYKVSAEAQLKSIFNS
jgi:polysaccharide pyruvyl transferase WcaK-like protein